VAVQVERLELVVRGLDLRDDGGRLGVDRAGRLRRGLLPRLRRRGLGGMVVTGMRVGRRGCGRLGLSWLLLRLRLRLLLRLGLLLGEHAHRCQRHGRRADGLEDLMRFHERLRFQVS
jgi:hypothetical protein